MNKTATTTNGLVCPAPNPHEEVITSAHGGGGRLTHRLIEKIFLPAFDNPLLASAHDGARFEVAAGRMAITTDSYVVQPLFFPGGDIGSLAVTGTVNDLAMCGARARYLSAGFILEEGLPISTLKHVAASMARIAGETGVQIVTGDTKVVERGRGDGLYINTTGLGEVKTRLPILPSSIMPGDAIILSGDIGRHGAAVMAARNDLGFKSDLKSDCEPLWEPVYALLEAQLELHCMRDLTRGGLATALVELAVSSETVFYIEETSIDVIPEVSGLCELLGFDPLYLANEGRFIVILPAEEADKAIETLRKVTPNRLPRKIGRIEVGEEGQVWLKTSLGAERPLEMLTGDQLPRIC